MKKDKHLPAGMFYKHGAYYRVRKNKWIPLGRDLADALLAYARESGGPAGTMPKAIERALSDIRRRGKPNTVRQYEIAAKRLKEAFAEFSPGQVRPVHVRQFLTHHQATPNMANRCRSVLLLAMRLAVESGECDANPVELVKPLPEAKRDRYLTDAEFAAIHDAGSEVLRITMALAYLTGQRIGDMLNIRQADLQDDGIHFRQEKTGKRLVIAWNDDLRAAVDRAKGLRKIAGFWLIRQANGQPYKYFGMRDQWRRACVKAGIEDATLHDLRAKSITDAKRQGLNPQLLAGHANERMTARYIRQREVDVATGPKLKKGA